MRPITDILRDYRKGKLVEVATQDLADVVRSVLATGQKGELTVTLTIKPNKGDDHQVLITASVKKKEPREAIQDAIFFTDNDGGLHRADPRQTEMELRAIHAAPRGAAQ